jgi:pimeloyl-ACP methyl ester carboxylesterase
MPHAYMFPGFEAGDEGTRELVIILHAYMSGPENLKHVRNVAHAHRRGADFFIPAMQTGFFSCEDPANIVRELLDSVDRLSSAKGGSGYDRITLIGHSLGALLARKLYVCARGENSDAPFESCLSEVAARPRAWADRVERIILLAGLNRGWSLSHHLSIRRSIEWTVGRWLAAYVLKLWTGQEPLILAIYRGAPFITQLRIQWLSMVRREKKAMEAVKKEITLAPTIQLLGSIDDMVSPEDNIDLVTGSEFVYLDVPMTGHANVVEMDNAPAGKERRRVFETALSEDPETLRIKSLQPGDYQVVPNERIKHVIFVIHGIRDKGYWTQKIARRAMALWRDRNHPDPQPNFASITSTYGYFQMLPFIILSRRLEKVHWLMDQYTEALARYPNADFYYVGHSNGT